MQTVCELSSFRRAALNAGMSEDVIAEVVLAVSQIPTLGDEIPGTGGCRKFRWRRGNKGKSGGYRVITFYSGEAIPVFLLSVFSKGEKSNLTEQEKAALKTMTQAIISAYHNRTSAPQTRTQDEQGI